MARSLRFMTAMVTMATYVPDMFEIRCSIFHASLQSLPPTQLPGAVSYFVGTALSKEPANGEVLCPALRDSHRSVNQLVISTTFIF
jgi:hypothetical protein